ncbi:MAG: NAD(P)/FAD-dependent oxidoreductase [Pseudomonadota bacterium]|nr:MAG: NAD(P)/FAD-dependent oxidoreductase [Pseudomonadota bacterium]
MSMSHVAVIGAGVMGLACAYDLLRKGHQVTIYEADDRVGGMSAHFDFGGLSIERYYHFICKPDKDMFRLLADLGISDKLKWRPTKMGYFYDGTLYEWGTPLALLKFPRLSLLSKLRYGFHMYLSTKRERWQPLDGREATEWIKRWIGGQAYDVLWRRLFELKFHRFTGNLSAAWIWARIKRVGQSRKNMFQEEMGYLEGGSESLLVALETAICDLGGEVCLNTPVEQIENEGERLTGVCVQGALRKFDAVVSTVPLPFVPRLIPGLPEDYLARYRSVENIGVVCVVFKLRRGVSDNFWLNVSDTRMDIPGIIEFSNLRPLPQHVVYVPYYLPQDHPRYQQPNANFIVEATGHLKQINPELSDDDIVHVHASRYGFAQPICPPRFLDNLPPIRTPVRGLYVADTSYYYPEDRSISESVRIGREIAAML